MTGVTMTRGRQIGPRWGFGRLTPTRPWGHAMLASWMLRPNEVELGWQVRQGAYTATAKPLTAGVGACRLNLASASMAAGTTDLTLTVYAGSSPTGPWTAMASGAWVGVSTTAPKHGQVRRWQLGWVATAPGWYYVALSVTNAVAVEVCCAT